MVVGVYGFLYLYAAQHPERARPIIAVGLLGKLLGPIGAVATIGRGEMPARMTSLLVLNDIIWCRSVRGAPHCSEPVLLIEAANCSAPRWSRVRPRSVTLPFSIRSS